MASEPLVDLDRIDFDQLVATKAQVLELLQQRGRFEMVDGIHHMDIEAGTIVGFKAVRGDDWWTTDHIPGRPLFPGALMVEAAAQLCTYHFLNAREDLVGAFVGFGGLDHVRFRASVEPDTDLILVGKLDRMRSRMFTYDAQGFVNGKLAFEAGIRGVVV